METKGQTGGETGRQRKMDCETERQSGGQAVLLKSICQSDRQRLTGRKQRDRQAEQKPDSRQKNQLLTDRDGDTGRETDGRIDRKTEKDRQ